MRYIGNTPKMKIGRIGFLAKLEKHISQEGLENIEWAYQLSKHEHRNQLRDDGSRYFDHPKECALILIDELHIFDSEMICAMLMHDLVEDSFILSHKEIKRRLGVNVALWVETLTKVDDNEENHKDYRSYWFQIE